MLHDEQSEQSESPVDEYVEGGHRFSRQFENKKEK